ncbi:MAG TPA: hypothetical protein VK862_02675, partial [Afifellaceae bacterium]|nr:hypothetical protein [Afifellaceae bacterium]
SVAVEPDRIMDKALCLGPECGRCLKACPGDVVGHWTRDWPACDRYRSPHGFHHLTDFLSGIIEAGDIEAQKAMLRSEDSFDLWQSILRGAGVVTGCRRCQDVCPVGDDYEAMLKDALEDIPENSDDKEKRLAAMSAAEADVEKMPAEFQAQKRWIGAYSGADRKP